MRFDAEYDAADWEQWQDEIGDQMIDQAEMESRHVDSSLR